MAAGKLAFIDALRGYAVALVIASHAFPLVRELPWPVKRFTNLGFFGVQLFFVISCYTLARSWRQREVGRHRLRDFFVRRLLRIAPPFYLAAVLYAWTRPAPGIDAARILTLATFTNGWSPGQMPTVAGIWEGVPGGWSIAAECSFYVLFPIIIVALRGVGSALAALAASLPLAWLLNALGSGFAATYGVRATDQFLYYWLPNQLPVFLCGLVMHEALHPARRLPRSLPQGGEEGSGPQRTEWLLCAGLLLFASLAFVPLPRLPMPAAAFIDSPLLAAIAFAVIAASLALRPSAVICNAAIVRLGQASFSAYLLHFAVLDLIAHLLPGLLAATGVVAVAAGCGVFALALAVTFALAQATYRLVELPAIRLGGTLTAAAARRSRC